MVKQATVGHIDHISAHIARPRMKLQHLSIKDEINKPFIISELKYVIKSGKLNKGPGPVP